MPKTHQLEPGRQIRLADCPTTAGTFHDNRKQAEKDFAKLRKKIALLQHRLYSEGKQSLLVVLQAMDAGGKDGTIRRVFEGVNPQGTRVTSFKVPSKEELAHDYLWRIHKAAPQRGMIGVFNRSHYEDVLVVRVEKIVPEAIWRRRYDEINTFEKHLSDNSTRILKFYLHISKSEQRERFQDRLDDPTKNWKFSLDDLEKRKLWNEYQAAYEDALNRCTTEWAPWFAIPADQKWYRNLAIARVLHATLVEMDPQFPASEDLESVVID
ncbi:MAG: polyphosphate kinase 2 family protein [Acidobacteriota bacterium]|nr:polyphosphate kinase 2 family protein [Acidobacteriota bacterium]